MIGCQIYKVVKITKLQNFQKKKKHKLIMKMAIE